MSSKREYIFSLNLLAKPFLVAHYVAQPVPHSLVSQKLNRSDDEMEAVEAVEQEPRLEACRGDLGREGRCLWLELHWLPADPDTYAVSHTS